MDVEALEIKLLLEAVAQHYGYDFRGYAPDSMRRRVMAALAKSGAAHLGELQHRVLTDPDAFAAMLDELTIRVTSLFRDPGTYRVLRTRVIPILRSYPSIKVWHAGCATGEEVYAMAVMLKEEGLYERSQLYGTDLSAMALAQAKQGIYPESVAGTFVANHLESGATSALGDNVVSAYGGVAFNDELKKNILFFQHNLTSDHPFGEMNVVFCRNVLIYFARELRERVLAKLCSSLSPGGFLCLGTSERLSRQEQQGRFTDFATDERIYRFEGSP